MLEMYFDEMGLIMENKKLLKLNSLVNRSYECLTFTDFLKLAILQLHDLVMYDSGMFFCGISRDCSFFKPYIGGNIDQYYQTQRFSDQEDYLAKSENAGKESYVYKALDYTHGIIQISNEPRAGFLQAQDEFHIACIRIVNKGQFLGEIYLHRSKDKPDFNDEDLFVLRLLQPHISTVFGIIHTITAVKFLEAVSPAVNRKGMCILDHEYNLTGGNVAGLEMLKIQTVYGSSILYHIKELCEDLVSTQKRIDAVALAEEVYSIHDGEICVSVYCQNKNKLNKNPQFIIVMEPCNAKVELADYKFKFTKREADIIDGIVQGKSNFQLADALSLSENTIKTHIKSIYRKVGANNRTELTYILMLSDK